MTVDSSSTANATPEEFVIDPFAADINPGTASGQKLFLQACTAVKDSEKLTATVEKQHIVMEEITSLVQQFCWGTQVLAVKLADDPSTTKSLLTENHDLSMKDLKLQAYKIWGGGASNATEIPIGSTSGRRDQILTECKITSSSTNDEKKTFYARVRSTMIRRALEGRFDKKTLKNVRLHRKEYEWRNSTTGEVHQDGATMLKVLIDILKPGLKSGLKEYKTIISEAEAKKYKNNPIDMLDAMESAYDEITVTHGKTYDSYMEELFRALKTFPNRIFTDYVIRLEDDWEADEKEGDIDELITKVRFKYNNMFNSKKWDYVDPADAKIMALATNLEQLKKELSDEKAKNASKKKQLPFDSRRTEFVGQTTTIDGVDYVWCDKGHKSRASPDGMYMPSGHDHDKWLEARNKRRNQGSRTASSNSTTDSASKTNSGGKKMVLSDDLKAALVTMGGMSQSEADALVERLN